MNSYLKFSEPSSGGIYLSLLLKTQTCIPNLYYFGCLHSQCECLLGLLCFCKYRVYSDGMETEIFSHSLSSAAVPPTSCGWAAEEGLPCQLEALYVSENTSVGHLAAAATLETSRCGRCEVRNRSSVQCLSERENNQSQQEATPE